MVRSIWSKSLVTAFACAGLTWAQQATSTQPATSTPASKQAAEQFVTIRQGNQEQRCKVLSSWKAPEGAVAYKVQAVDTGEIMTIVESGPSMTAPSQSGGRMQAMRIFRWGKDKTPPAGVPLSPSDVSQMAPPAVTVQETPVLMPVPSSSQKTTQTTKTTQVQSKTVMPASTTAEASDWRRSWGKLNDSKSTGSSSTAQARSERRSIFKKASMPKKAETRQADPLQMPEQYSTPDTQKKQGTTIPETKKTTDEATKVSRRPATRTTTSQPQVVPAAAVTTKAPDVKPATTIQPATTSPSMPVVTMPQTPKPAMPAPARQVQPAPVIPQTVVTVPPTPKAVMPPPIREPQRTPVIPARNNASQSSVTVGTAPAPNNAFSSVPTKEEVARETNAFPKPSSGPAIGMTVSAPRMAPQASPVAPAAVMMAQPKPVMVEQPAGKQNVMPATYEGPQQGMMTQWHMQANAGRQWSTPQVQNCLATLHDSLYPSQREWAAETLATLDPMSHPHVVKALMTGAREDPAATVRAACVRCLAKMKANSPEVLSTITALKTDLDPRVRLEVDHALQAMTSASNPGLQPVGSTMPVK